MSGIDRRVFEARKQHLGLTQRELAQLLNIEPVNVSRWERGITEPSSRNLRELARMAKLPVSWFYAQ